MEVEVEHRPVEGGDVRAQRHGGVQRGDVAEPDDGTRVAADGVVVDAVEDAHGAVAAAGEKDGVDVVRPQVMVELFDALVVRAGEVVADVVVDVRRERDAVAAPLQALGTESNAFHFARSGDRADGDVAIRRERARQGQHRK